MNFPKPKNVFILLMSIGFCLMFAIWLQSGEMLGFFLLFFLVVMALLRWRFPFLRYTIFVDCVACIILTTWFGVTSYFAVIVLFEAMYRKVYWTGLTALFLLFRINSLGLEVFDMHLAAMLVLGALCGLFLGKWGFEVWQKFTLRDMEAKRFYESENLRNDMTSALTQIERMTIIAERARIARDLHDNAGHEIVAAYISFQTIRPLFENEGFEILELYDAALERLEKGVDKVRESAHNLQTVTLIGVESFLSTCQRFPGCPVSFQTHGDTSSVPIYIWSALEACLNESLTNVMKHSAATHVSVDLDVTEHIVRLCIENNGARAASENSDIDDGTPKIIGNGLQNLKQRIGSIGGNLSVSKGDMFRVVCVIPIDENKE